jgi:hypothetical protein
MDQARNLGLMNENIMKHRDSKQREQRRLKIKQQNNEPSHENQRCLTFPLIYHGRGNSREKEPT